MDGHKDRRDTEWFHPRYASSASAANPLVLPSKMKEMCIMKSNNNAVVPEAREALDKFKMEAAADLDVPTSYWKITYTYRFGPLNWIIMIYIPFISSKIHI